MINYVVVWNGVLDRQGQAAFTLIPDRDETSTLQACQRLATNERIRYTQEAKQGSQARYRATQWHKDREARNNANRVRLVEAPRPRYPRLVSGK